MLHFYYIDDNIKSPNYPEEINLKFAFELDYKSFIDLQNHEIVNSKFNYFTDFRWNTKTVTQLLQAIENKQNNFNKNIEKFQTNLHQTLELKTGLIAYCD